MMKKVRDSIIMHKENNEIHKERKSNRSIIILINTRINTHIRLFIPDLCINDHPHNPSVDKGTYYNTSNINVYIYKLTFPSLLFISGIISFFLVAFSDPGSLTEEFKTTLNEEQIKNLEEVYIIY